MRTPRSCRAAVVVLLAVAPVMLLQVKVVQATSPGPEVAAASLRAELGGSDQWWDEPDAFGLQDGEYEFLSAADFSLFNIATGLTLLYETSEGTLYLHNAGVDDMVWASPHVPQGAQIQGFRMFYCDTHAANNPRLTLMRFTGYTAFTSDALFSEVTSEETPGCTSVYWSLLHTVDLGTPAGTFYAFLVRLPASGYSLRLKGIRVFWKRQVSPAPAIATFTDVPTGHWAYQHIEALAASGITAGCSATEYCPDATLTRAQMAVFLAKALGLHWYAY